MHQEALRGWRHMHAHAPVHTTGFPGREDFDLRGTLDQNRRTAKELDLRQAFVQGQFPRCNGISTAHRSFSKVSIQGVTDHRDSIGNCFSIHRRARPDDECQQDNRRRRSNERRGAPPHRPAHDRWLLEPAGVHRRLLQQTRLLIGEFQIKASRLPVIAQQSFELRVLLRRDFAIELGMDQ